MEFKVISAQRGRTHVDAVPTDPEGHFTIDDDLYVPTFAVAKIALRGIKLRHIRAFQRGDSSALNRYVVRYPEQPGFVSFVKCAPGVPDPLQPIGTSIYVRSAQEVPLPPVAS